MSKQSESISSSSESLEQKYRKRPERRATVLDESELKVIGRIGRELAALSPDGIRAVISYYHERFGTENDGQE